MNEVIVDRLDVRASIPEIPDARRRITARVTDDKAEETDIPDASTSGRADGIDEPAEGMNETDAGIEIRDDGMNVIDAVTNEHDDRLDVIDATTDEPAEPTDQPAKGDEVGDEPIDRMEERTHRNVNRIEVMRAVNPIRERRLDSTDRLTTESDRRDSQGSTS